VDGAESDIFGTTELSRFVSSVRQ